LIELRFHRDIYRGASLDETVKVFGAYASFAMKEEAEHWVVEVTAPSSDRERRVAGEFGNYALGLTVKAGGAGARAPEKVGAS
jgi:hypothetical protein